MEETNLNAGATGTVGTKVVKQLSGDGEMARSNSDNTFRNLNRLQVVQPDYNIPDSLAAAFKGVDKLFLGRTSNLVSEAKHAGILINCYSAIYKKLKNVCFDGMGLLNAGLIQRGASLQSVCKVGWW
jgi:hypothetical protein